MRRNAARSCTATATALLWLAGLCLGVAAAQPASPWTPEKLMAVMATVREGTVRFREERHLRHLQSPVVLTGALSFKAPDLLVKEIRMPRWERSVITGNMVRIESKGPGGVRSFLLSDYPALQILIVAFRAVLTGNLAALRKHFIVGLSGDRRSWTLRLIPKAAALKERFAAVTIKGSGKKLTTAEFAETSGDRILFHMFVE